MPNKEIIETYPLYRKYRIEGMPSHLDRFTKVKINMSCPICKSNQTYTMRNEYYENFPYRNVPSR